MTREEAIEALKYSIGVFPVTDRAVSALDMAVKALEQEPCEDAISRQATVERLCKVAEFMNEKRDGLGSPYVMAALFIQDNKDEFPSVTPKQRTGQWIRHTDASGNSWHACPACGHIAYTLSHYCPDCGAAMMEVHDDD